MARYRKSRMWAPQGCFECEGRGLQWLGEAQAQGGPRVVDVYEWGKDFLDIERVSPCSPTAKAAHDFGAALARMHDAGTDHFGSAPAGYDGTCYLYFSDRNRVPISYVGQIFPRDTTMQKRYRPSPKQQ